MKANNMYVMMYYFNFYRAINTFVSNQADGSGTRLALSSNIQLTSSQSSTPAIAGSTTQMSNIVTNVDLSGIDCSQFSYVCVELTKGPVPSIDFDVTFQTSVTCSEVACLGE